MSTRIEYDEEKYDDAEYRLAYGCSIPLWGEHGYDDSLIGLEIKWIFPHGGACTGTVRSVKEAALNNSMMNVYWTVSANENENENENENNELEEYLLPMEVDDILECYYLLKDADSRPDWLSYEHKFSSPLFNLDAKSSTLSNFHLPYYACEIFPWIQEEESEDRWRITIACLNDPSCTKHYDPAGTQAYPLGLLLTLIVICKYYDPTTKVPMIFKDTPEARMTLKMADEYARDLNNNGHRPLEALEEMVQDLNKEVESFLAIASKRAPTEKERKFVVMNCEAVILTMSREYENDNASWYMTSDTDRLFKVTYDLIMGLGKALLHSTAKSTIQELDNADNIATHLVEGNFIQFVEDEDFKESEEYKDAVQVWEDLVKLTERLKLGPIDIDTKG